MLSKRRLKQRIKELSFQLGRHRKNIIDCKDCPFGINECGGLRCPTKDEWNIIKKYFQEIYKKKSEPEYFGGPITL